MQLNYHEGEYLSSLGNTLFGGFWNGTDRGNFRNGIGLFYLWHHNHVDNFELFCSLSQ